MPDMSNRDAATHDEYIEALDEPRRGETAAAY